MNTKRQGGAGQSEQDAPEQEDATRSGAAASDRGPRGDARADRAASPDEGQPEPGQPERGQPEGGSDLAEELATANDRILRLQAEMQNVRNRGSREISDIRRYAALPILRDLLPVVDNIERAIKAAEAAGEAENLLEGFRLVRQQLVTVLNQHECEPVDAENQPFDPAFHEAILQQPSDAHPSGTVMMVTQSGYRLHDRVVRPAQVIVSSGPANGGQ